MKITYLEDRYIAISKFSEKDTLKKAGFRWNPKGKHWYTDNARDAAKLIAYADPEARTSIDRQLQEQDAARRASRAAKADPGLMIPAPPGLKYLDYQKAGILYASERPATLIADEMGLGKTIQAIGVINLDPTIKRVLVICPASLRLNWKREIEKWLVRDMQVQIAVGKHWPWPTPDIVVINYDILTKHLDRIHAIEWDCLIVDECHFIKNPKAQRTQAVFGHSVRGKEFEPAITATRRLFLTGTPIVNRPREIQPILASILPDEYGNFFRFALQYCGGYKDFMGHWDFSGASNLDELQDRLRSTCMVRRLKIDVLTELPPKRRQVIEIPPPPGMSKQIESEQAAWERHQQLERNLKAAAAKTSASASKEEHTAAVRNLKAARRASFQDLSTVRKETAIAKVPYVAAHVKDALEGGTEKIVVFTHHHEVTDRLVAEFQGNCVKLDGRDKMEDRDDSVKQFQAQGGPQVFIGGIMAAGVGLTLTAAAHVVFAELDWVPGNMSQAEDRCHRIGQKDSVLVQHIVMEQSIDAHMANTVIGKQEVIDQALDDDPGEQTIEEVQAPAPKPEPKRTVDPKLESPPKPSTEDELSQGEIDTIHRELQTLAGLCDGANTKDGFGFSKFDAEFGRSLANAPRLTPKQAAAGKKITKKYHRQLELFPTVT